MKEPLRKGECGEEGGGRGRGSLYNVQRCKAVRDMLAIINGITWACRATIDESYISYRSVNPTLHNFYFYLYVQDYCKYLLPQLICPIQDECIEKYVTVHTELIN